MRLFGLAGLPILLLAGCAHEGESIYSAPQPRDIPYFCSDGHQARISYENGGWFVKARAHLVWNERSIALQARPPTYGLNYVSADDDAGPILFWTARGEEAWISQLGRNPGSETLVLAHCTRIRQGGAAPEPASH